MLTFVSLQMCHIYDFSRNVFYLLYLFHSIYVLNIVESDDKTPYPRYFCYRCVTPNVFCICLTACSILVSLLKCESVHMCYSCKLLHICSLPMILWHSCCSICNFLWRSLFVLLLFFFWPLCCSSIYKFLANLRGKSKHDNYKLENVENVNLKKLPTKIRGELRCSGRMNSFSGAPEGWTVSASHVTSSCYSCCAEA